MWRHIPLIQVFGRQSQRDLCEFKISMVYIAMHTILAQKGCSCLRNGIIVLLYSVPYQEYFVIYGTFVGFLQRQLACISTACLTFAGSPQIAQGYINYETLLVSILAIFQSGRLMPSDYGSVECFPLLLDT